MSSEYKDSEYKVRESEGKSQVGSDDAVKVLTEFLSQFRAGLQPPSLSKEAKAAIAGYNELRRALDHSPGRTN